MKGHFSLLDLYDQMQAMKKMGSLSKIVDMIPGFGQLKLPKEALNIQEDKLKKWKNIMQSMTRKELEEPDTLNGSRVKRVAKGSASTVNEVRELIKQYNQAKKMGKMLSGGRNMKKMMKKFGGKLPPGFDPSMLSK